MGNKSAQVSLIDVGYNYPGNQDFSLEIPELAFSAGMCSAVCGPNGSGKTTLGKLIAGLLRPLRGRILLAGENIAGWPLGKIGSQVGYLFQDPARQIFAPTVLEEITFPLTLKGMDEKPALALAQSMLVRFEMKRLENATTYTLSRGEKQRLAIIATLVHDPIFLVFDEPTTGLDARARSILGGMIRQLTEQGVGILLISHDRSFVNKHAGIIYQMAEGRVL